MAFKRGGAKYAKGKFKPKNPEKYVGKGSIIYRSSWENVFMRFVDENPNIMEWCSEGIRIPYKNPITGKNTNYVPDFLVKYKDKNNNVIVELIEIKPYDQSIINEGANPKLRATVAQNHAKWGQASTWCKKQGIKFRVITERDLFRK